MKKGLKIALAVTGGLLALGTAAYFFVRNQAKLLMDYCYGIVSGKINQFTYKTVDIDLILEIGNKSMFDFVLKGYSFDVTLNGSTVLKLRNPYENQLIKAEGISYLKLKIVFSPEQSIKDILTPQTISLLLTSPDAMVIGINGTLSVDTAIATINDLPININTTIKELRTGTGETKNRKCYKK